MEKAKRGLIGVAGLTDYKGASMTLRRIGLLIWVGVVLLPVQALQAKTVTLGSADNRTDVSLNLGDMLVVELSSGDVNGFSWVLHLPKASGLSALNEDVLPADRKAVVPVQTRRFRFNAAKVGDSALVFGFETAEKVPGAAPQDTSAYSVRVHIASGAPRPGTAILFGVYKGTMPCADCEGLETTLRLYAKEQVRYDVCDLRSHPDLSRCAAWRRDDVRSRGVGASAWRCGRRQCDGLPTKSG